MSERQKTRLESLKKRPVAVGIGPVISAGLAVSSGLAELAVTVVIAELAEPAEPAVLVAAAVEDKTWNDTVHSKEQRPTRGFAVNW